MTLVSTRNENSGQQDHAARKIASSTPRPGARPRTRDGLARPKSGQVRVLVGALGLSELGVQAAGIVKAVGPEAGGFAPGDRVCYHTSLQETGLLSMESERDLIGFPKDVSLEAAAAYMPLGLVARTVVKQLHSIGKGNLVSVAPDSSGADAFVKAWALDLGASIVEPAVEGKADVVVTAEDFAVAKRWRYGNGLAQIAAADVFNEVRRGVFDNIKVKSYPFTEASRAQAEFARRSAPRPIVLLPAAA